MDENLRREIILENYQNPINRERIKDNRYIKVNSNNESCIDNIDLFILIENNKIRDIKFDGEACAISTASTSLMIKSLIDKSLDEVKDICENFTKMINGDSKYEISGELLSFNEIYKQANRKHCAILPWLGIKKAIEEYKNQNNTD